ncbi:MAG: SGNH/GDSL hydrolase family protein [Gemmatimonadaceae bacterium]|nr:SGNH/GDSL hydrolase family protein [Gemmatimonadaceae bacterium]
MRTNRRSFTRMVVGLAGILAVANGCHGQSPAAPGIATGGTRVLFIGNSLTYSNNLPGMYIALARLAGNDSVQAAVVAFPDFALEDHWAEGTARRSLSQHKWEYVVMQQGSSALAASQVNLRTWATQFAAPIRAAGAVPVMFMVWPTADVLGNFPSVLKSYRDAASAIDGIFAPAGDAWTAHGDLAALYSGDGLHPSIRGTYTAALVLLERTIGIRPSQLPATIPGTTVGEADVRALQQAAQVALDRNPARPGAVVPGDKTP